LVGRVFLFFLVCAHTPQTNEKPGATPNNHKTQKKHKTHENKLNRYKDSANAGDKAYLKAYLGSDGTDIAWDFIRAAMESVSNTTVFLMQDVMRLDNAARMNVPGQAEGNWAWRMGDAGVWARLAPEAAALRELAYVYNRAPPGVEVELGGSAE
jgi:4-alpha-glucanotransferase